MNDPTGNAAKNFENLCVSASLRALLFLVINAIRQVVAAASKSQ
jgi:hypothetical protein